MRRAVLLLCLLGLPSQVPAERAAPAPAPCKTVDDCWLDGSGAAIRRPARFKGKPLPQGNCGSRILWLRTELRCDEGICVARHRGDKC